MESLRALYHEVHQLPKKCTRTKRLSFKDEEKMRVVFDQPLFAVGAMCSGTTFLGKSMSRLPDVSFCPFELRHVFSDCGIAMASPKTQDHDCKALTAEEATQEQHTKLTAALYETYLLNTADYETQQSIFFCKNPHLSNKLPWLHALYPHLKLLAVTRSMFAVVNSLNGLFKKKFKHKGFYHYWPEASETSGRRCFQGFSDKCFLERVDRGRCFPGGELRYLAEYWLETNLAIHEFIAFTPSVDHLWLQYEEIVQEPCLVDEAIKSWLSLGEKNNMFKKLKTNTHLAWMNRLDKPTLLSLADFARAALDERHPWAVATLEDCFRIQERFY